MDLQLPIDQLWLTLMVILNNGFDEEEEVGKQMIVRIKLIVTVTINTV